MDRNAALRAVVAVVGTGLGVLLVRRTIRGSGASPGVLADLPDDGRAPALLRLLAQVDAAYPSRSRAADGILPSAAHHAKHPTSDHERGDALDITLDPMHGPDLDRLAEDLLLDPRVTYVIWNRRIANRAIDGGAWRPYQTTAIQTDPHTGHLHVSVAAARRANASPWRFTVVPEPPAGYVMLSDRAVTPETATWAATLLRDPTFHMGKTRTRTLGNREILARAEVHPPSPSIDHPHRGVTLFERRDRVA